MRQIASATAFVLMLAACSGQEAAPPPTSDTATLTPASESAQESSASDADAAIDSMESGTATGANSTDSAASDSGQREIAAIPDRFRGTWATSSEHCVARSFNRMTVAADRVNFFEDGGYASDIRIDGNALAVTYPFETPDGTTENRVVNFARETQYRMRVRRGADESTTYVRCPTD